MAEANRQSGIILELGRRHAVILTQTGQFLRCKRQIGMTVGEMAEISAEEILFPRTSRLGRKWRRILGPASTPLWRRPAFLSGATVVILLAAGLSRVLLGLSPLSTVYADVAVDAVPNVVFSVNAAGRVESVNAIYGTVPANLSALRGQSMDTVLMSLIASAAKQQGVKGSAVIVTTAPVKQGVKVNSIEARAKKDVMADLAKNHWHASVVDLPMSPHLWTKAVQAKVPPTKLAAYFVLKQVGLPAAPSAQLDSAVEKAMANPKMHAKLRHELRHPNLNAVTSVIQDILAQWPVPSEASPPSVVGGQTSSPVPSPTPLLRTSSTISGHGHGSLGNASGLSAHEVGTFGSAAHTSTGVQEQRAKPSAKGSVSKGKSSANTGGKSGAKSEQKKTATSSHKPTHPAVPKQPIVPPTSPVHIPTSPVIHVPTIPHSPVLATWKQMSSQVSSMFSHLHLAGYMGWFRE